MGRAARRAIAPEPAANLRDGGVIAPGFDEALDELRGIDAHCGEFLVDLERRERERTGIPSLKVEFNRVHGFYIEVTHAHVQRVPAEYRRRQTLKNAERYITPELKTFEDKALSAQERALAREKQLFEALLADLAPAIPAFQQAADALADLDVLTALAERAQALRLSRPRFASEGGITILGGRHPVVERQVGDFIPNDLVLDRDRRLLVVTGPNMGGKSTYMRQAAVVGLLAHCGVFVPAAEATIGPLDAIFTRIGASDDLAGGRSTFMVEMTEAAYILNRATPRSLVLIDEIGRGTSTFDGLALAWAIAHHLAEKNRSLTLFATHYFELTALAAEIEGCANVHFDAVEHRDGIVFLHAVEEGPANRSYGLQVAKLAGVPGDTVRQARAYLARLDQFNARVDGQQDLFAVPPATTSASPETRARRSARRAHRRARPRCALAARGAGGAVRTQAARHRKVGSDSTFRSRSPRNLAPRRGKSSLTLLFRARDSPSMVVPVRPVHVAVRDFFLRRGPDLDDGSVEAQPLAREFVVAVEHRLALRDAGDTPDVLLTVLLGDEVAADRDVGRQRLHRLHADHLGVVLSERVVGLEGYRDRVAHLLEVERLLDLREHAGVAAVEVRHRLAGLLDQGVLVVEELERDRDDGVGEDVHRGLGRGQIRGVGSRSLRCGPAL